MPTSPEPHKPWPEYLADFVKCGTSKSQYTHLCVSNEHPTIAKSCLQNAGEKPPETERGIEENAPCWRARVERGRWRCRCMETRGEPLLRRGRGRALQRGRELRGGSPFTFNPTRQGFVRERLRSSAPANESLHLAPFVRRRFLCFLILFLFPTMTNKTEYNFDSLPFEKACDHVISKCMWMKFVVHHVLHNVKRF